MLDYVGLLSAGNEEMVIKAPFDTCKCEKTDYNRRDLPGRRLPNGSRDMVVRKSMKQRKRRCLISSWVCFKYDLI